MMHHPVVILTRVSTVQKTCAPHVAFRSKKKTTALHWHHLYKITKNRDEHLYIDPIVKDSESKAS